MLRGLAGGGIDPQVYVTTVYYFNVSGRGLARGLAEEESESNLSKVFKTNMREYDELWSCRSIVMFATTRLHYATWLDIGA